MRSGAKQSLEYDNDSEEDEAPLLGTVDLLGELNCSQTNP